MIFLFPRQSTWVEDQIAVALVDEILAIFDPMIHLVMIVVPTSHQVIFVRAMYPANPNVLHSRICLMENRMNLEVDVYNKGDLYPLISNRNAILAVVF